MMAAIYSVCHSVLAGTGRVLGRLMKPQHVSMHGPAKQRKGDGLVIALLKAQGWAIRACTPVVLFHDGGNQNTIWVLLLQPLQLS